MRHNPLRAVAMVTAALGLTLAIGVGTASAATAPAAAPAASQSGCNENGAITLASATLTHGNEVRLIELRYSPSSQCVWARLSNGQPGDHVWVWNENTNALRSADINTGHDNHTDAIHDDGTLSHACMNPVYDPTIKVCTDFA